MLGETIIADYFSGLPLSGVLTVMVKYNFDPDNEVQSMAWKRASYKSSQKVLRRLANGDCILGAAGIVCRRSVQFTNNDVQSWNNHAFLRVPVACPCTNCCNSTAEQL